MYRRGLRKVLKKMFGPRRKEITKKLRKLPSDDFNTLYSTKYYLDDEIEEEL
jgi:hypothetical protein